MIKENFIGLFADSFRENWDLPGFSDYGSDTTFTYADIARQVARLHILFEQCGIQRNDKIALIGRNSSRWAITYIATVTYGAIIVPILHDFNPNDIHHIANHSESRLLFTDESLWESLEEEKFTHIEAVFSLRDFSCLTVINRESPEGEGATEAAPPRLKESSLQPERINSLFEAKYPKGFNRDDIRYVDKPNSELASLNYTSGTTGFSKGVMTTCNNLAGNIIFGFQTKLVAPGYNIVSFLPLAHSYGCAFDFLAPTCAGCHIRFVGKTPSPKVLLRAFAEVKPNVIFTVPLIIERIYKSQILPLIAKPTMRWVLNIPLLNQTLLGQIRKKLIDALGGNFREIIIGGAPLNVEVEEFFLKMKFPFTVGYGMTECAPLISYAPKEEFVPKSCGRILDTMEVKIVDPDPATGEGEICVRGEHVMVGYYKNPEATEQAFDADGWLRTGDSGTVDEAGNITIRGRVKTMILGSNGQNIYPEELESRLNNMPYVMESLVLESRGKLVALVYPDYEAVDSQHLTQEQLEEKMEENRQMVNALSGSYEKLTKIQLYPHEFEKTPKKSIKRYLYNV